MGFANTNEPCREIIDESDVYIDVHKAIRRMAPAPKARYQRRHSQGQPPDGNDGKSSEDTKVGEEDPSDTYENRKSYNSVPDHHEHRDRSGSPMTGTFLLRRTSAGIDGRMENVPVRASFNDIRQHLKHLGPSNPASNPKATRSTTVKIKPRTVHPDQPRSNTIADEAIQEEPRDEDDDGDETTSLLRGKIAPKDGVQALAQSYGATGTPALPRGLENVPPIKVDVPKDERATQGSAPPSATDLATAVTSSSVRPEQRSRSGSDSTPSGSNSPYGPKKGLFARSGSITENVVESRGGIRKVVLETTSSNDDEDEALQGGPGRNGKAASRSNMSLPHTTAEGDEDEDGNGGVLTVAGAAEAGASGTGAASAGEQNGGSNSGAGGGSSGGKKKNRRKKRKGNKF